MTSPPGNQPRRELAHLPRVAILGRPNVGKSTLFNVLLGRRRAITYSDPGVTRDPIEVECRLGGARMALVDTGGYTSGAEGLDGVVAARSLKTAREADLVLLVLDAVETTPEDEEFIRRLRPCAEKLLLVVNKVDTPDRDLLVWNAHAHGFPNVIGVSAAHGRGLDRLKETVAGMLEAQLEEPLSAEGQSSGSRTRPRPVRAAEDEIVRIAILGKPNTGKSSLANRLTGEDGSIVSPVPGTTRDVVERSFLHRGKTFQVLDTAGIRRKSRVQDPVEYYSVNRAIESIGRADLVFLTIDATEGLVDQDKKIAGQAVKEGRGVVIVLSKWDLLKNTQRLLEEVSEKVRFQFPVLGFAPIVPVSALTGFGVRSLLDTALEVWNQLHRRVGTGRLNQALEAWSAHYRLPVRGKNYKIRFMTQISANPVRFVVFVNRLSGFPVSYTQYLENCIRRDLGVPLVPVGIEFRQSRKHER
ncbi:MAG: ribosome biogenesis GTPase Der [Spirochaetia bacterium]